MLIYFLFIYFSAGWYCSGRATQAMPTDPNEGGKCLKGEYCPVGSPAAIDCPGGMYCASERLESPTDNCTQGGSKIAIKNNVAL